MTTMRMDELGAEQVGKTIAWRPAEDDPRYAPVRDRLAPVTRCHLVKIAEKFPQPHLAEWDTAFPDGTVMIVTDGPNKRNNQVFLVGAHWPVEVS